MARTIALVLFGLTLSAPGTSPASRDVDSTSARQAIADSTSAVPWQSRIQLQGIVEG